MESGQNVGSSNFCPVHHHLSSYHVASVCADSIRLFCGSRHPDRYTDQTKSGKANTEHDKERVETKKNRTAKRKGRRQTLTTSMILVFLVQCSEPQAKLPLSNRMARYLVLPPRTRTSWIRLAPSLVMAGCRPNSNFLFFRYCARRAPEADRLWRESRVIPCVK